MHTNATADGAIATTSYMAGAGASSAFRRLYARAANPEAFIPGGELIEVVRTEMLRASPGTRQPLDNLIRETVGWSSTAAERFQAVGDLTDPDGRRLLIRRAAVGWAPLGLACG